MALGKERKYGRELRAQEQAALVSRGFYLYVKRGLDVVVSLLGLAALSPLLLALAALIWLDDPHGSPLYSQIRCGRDGRPFRLYKFRSMCVDAEEKRAALQGRNEMTEPVFKMRDDPRVTRVGRVIRRISLDELPQLVNVLRGEMSIVGPRPPLPEEVEQYTPYQRQRLRVRPGLTCYWQVHRGRYEVSFDQWVEMDLKYIREQGFLVDAKILLRTVAAVLRGEGR